QIQKPHSAFMKGILSLLLSLVVWPGLSLGQTQKFASQFSSDAPEVPAAVRGEAASQPWAGAERGPVEGLKVLAREKGGALWLGSDQGAARFDAKTKERWDRWQYFYGRRWLGDDVVSNICVEETSPSLRVWIRTKTGVSLIEWRSMTLEAKAK